MVWLLLQEVHFSSVMALIIECINERAFKFSKVAQKAFEHIKHKLCQALVLVLPNFEDLFELKYDTSGVRIGVVLI